MTDPIAFFFDVVRQCVFYLDWCGQVCQASLVSHEVCHGDVLLAILSELRPVLADLVIVSQQSSVVKRGQGDGGEALGAAAGRATAALLAWDEAVINAVLLAGNKNLGDDILVEAVHDDIWGRAWAGGPHTQFFKLKGE